MRAMVRAMVAMRARSRAAMAAADAVFPPTLLGDPLAPVCWRTGLAPDRMVLAPPVLCSCCLSTRRRLTSCLRCAGDKEFWNCFTCHSIGGKGGCCWLVGCLTSQQHASVSQGRVCTDNFTCCHTEVEVVDQTFYLTQSQYRDIGPTSPSTDPIMPGAWQGSHWSANFKSLV